VSIDSCDSGLPRTVHFGHLGVCMHLIEVGLVALGCGLDSVLTWVPVGRADLAVFIGKLEGVDKTKGLVYAAADGQVIDSNLYKTQVSV
jgi:hypothetical protein